MNIHLLALSNCILPPLATIPSMIGDRDRNRHSSIPITFSITPEPRPCSHCQKRIIGLCARFRRQQRTGVASPRSCCSACLSKYVLQEKRGQSKDHPGPVLSASCPMPGVDARFQRLLLGFLLLWEDRSSGG